MKCLERLRRAARRKLGSKGGFSLGEMLLCCVILLLTAALITDTLDLGVRQFKARSRDSEAQILCNAISLAVRDQLACVSRVTKSGDNPSFYTNANGLGFVECRIGVDDDGKAVLKYTDDTGTAKNYKLLSDSAYAAYGDGLKAEIGVEAESGAFSVTVTVKNEKDSGARSEVTNSFTVEPILASVQWPTA